MERYYFNAPWFYVFSVQFRSCERNREVHFESSAPADFRVGQDGVVYAVRSFQLSLGPTEFLLYAKDKVTQEQWEVTVKVAPEPEDSVKVKHSNMSLELDSNKLNILPQHILC